MKLGVVRWIGWRSCPVTPSPVHCHLLSCHPTLIYILTASLNKKYKYKLITNVTLKCGWPTNEHHRIFPWRRVALWDVSFGRKCCISFWGRWRDSKIVPNVGKFLSTYKASHPRGLWTLCQASCCVNVEWYHRYRQHNFSNVMLNKLLFTQHVSTLLGHLQALHNHNTYKYNCILSVK
jgi:hypothetical protein